MRGDGGHLHAFRYIRTVFANGQSVQSTVVPRRPSPVYGLGKARLQSYRPWEQQFGLTIVRLQSAYKYRDCYLEILNNCGRLWEANGHKFE